MQLFLHELVSAGGLGPDAPPSLRAQGAAMLTAVMDDFQGVPGVKVTTLIAADTPGSWGPACRRIAAGEEEAAFAEAAARADATLVIAPEGADLLERRSGAVLARGGRLLGCQPDAIHLTGDKWALAQFWHSRNVTSPAIACLVRGANLDSTEGRSADLSAQFPLVCKPRHGAGAQATFFISQEADLSPTLNQAQAEMPGADFLLQHFVAGRAGSVAFLIGSRQSLALAPAWQHLSADGRFHYLGGSLPMPSPWRERALDLAARAVAGIAGLQGYVGVDLVLGDDGRDWAIEINPRLTTSYLGLRQLAEGNLAEIWLRLLRGETVEEMMWRGGVLHFTADAPSCPQ